MKNTKKITLCAVMAALATVIMLISHFPYLTYAVPAVSGLCVMIIVIEIDCKWAVLTYLSASVMAFLFAEMESKIMFIAFFGFYPIIKCLIEKIGKSVIEWIIKYLIFNLCIVTAYSLFAEFLLSPVEDMGVLNEYANYILLALANFVFAFYDVAISKISWLYLEKLHNKFTRFLK